MNPYREPGAVAPVKEKKPERPRAPGVTYESKNFRIVSNVKMDRRKFCVHNHLEIKKYNCMNEEYFASAGVSPAEPIITALINELVETSSVFQKMQEWCNLENEEVEKKVREREIFK